jgi:putative acetyltransferase
MHIRRFQVGDERALHAVFHSAIHGLACRDYAPEQIQAWAPADLDEDVWFRRMKSIQPFVVEHDQMIIAYADLQPSGYIDHFFVSAPWARQGVGSLLMEHLHAVAVDRAVSVLTSDVSRTAQPFFGKFGFMVMEHRTPVLRGVVVPNALMRKELASNPSKERACHSGLRPSCQTSGA